MPYVNQVPLTFPTVRQAVPRTPNCVKRQSSVNLSTISILRPLPGELVVHIGFSMVYDIRDSAGRLKAVGNLLGEPNPL